MRVASPASPGVEPAFDDVTRAERLAARASLLAAGAIVSSALCTVAALALFLVCGYFGNSTSWLQPPGIGTVLGLEVVAATPPVLVALLARGTAWEIAHDAPGFRRGRTAVFTGLAVGLGLPTTSFLAILLWRALR